MKPIIAPAIEPHPHDDGAALTAAQAAGFLIRSGRPFSILLAFTHWCARNGRPCVVGVRLQTVARIEVDGRQVWTGEPAELEAECQRIAGQQQPGLFTEVHS